MKFDNEAVIKFKAKSVNELFARSTVAAFVLQTDPTIEEMNDIKTAVSEAVTNCIVHAYDNEEEFIEMTCGITGNTVHIAIADNGKGITDIKQAMQPFYTTRPEDERSGMGFTVMDTFMDSLEVLNNSKNGITVKMTKIIGKSSN